MLSYYDNDNKSFTYYCADKLIKSKNGMANFRIPLTESYTYRAGVNGKIVFQNRANNTANKIEYTNYQYYDVRNK